MILLDTSFFIADARKADANYARACELRAAFAEPLATTEQVFSELITYLSKKDGAQKAHDYGQGLLETNVRILCTAAEDLSESLELVRKFEGMSFCDASSVVMARKSGIKKIASFDSDFDRVPGIQRLF